MWPSAFRLYRRRIERVGLACTVDGYPLLGDAPVAGPLLTEIMMTVLGRSLQDRHSHDNTCNDFRSQTSF